MSGNLSVEAQERYRFVCELLGADFPPPARVAELGAAPGDQIAHLAGLGYEATAVDIGTRGYDECYGCGRLDALRAVKNATKDVYQSSGCSEY